MEEEFNKLKCIVGHLAALDISPDAALDSLHKVTNTNIDGSSLPLASTTDLRPSPLPIMPPPPKSESPGSTHDPANPSPSDSSPTPSVNPSYLLPSLSAGITLRSSDDDPPPPMADDPPLSMTQQSLSGPSDPLPMLPSSVHPLPTPVSTAADPSMTSSPSTDSQLVPSLDQQPTPPSPTVTTNHSPTPSLHSKVDAVFPPTDLPLVPPRDPPVSPTAVLPVSSSTPSNISPSSLHYGSPSSLFRLANIESILHLQTQLTAANRTITSMHTEIQTLKDQIAQLTNKSREDIANTEVRLKNQVKASVKEIDERINDTQEDHRKLTVVVKDSVSKLQSFRDSQTNTNTALRQQLQTLSTARHTQHANSSTQSTQSNTLPEPDTAPSNTILDSQSEGDRSTQEYTVEVSNKYAALAEQDSRENNTPVVTTETNNTQHDQTENMPPKRSAELQTSSPKSTTAPPSPLAILMRKPIPPSCDSLLLGDSVLKGVEERRMSADGHTVKNLSVPGLTVQHLGQWLRACQPSIHIRHVTFHVGINSCSEGPVSVASWVQVITQLKRVFPRATLQASSIVPPVGHHPLKEPASLSTAHLQRACLQEGIVYIDHTPSFLAKSGAPRKSMYQDRLHPSAQGSKCLALNIRYQRSPPPTHVPPHNRPPPHRGPSNIPSVSPRHRPQPSRFPAPRPNGPVTRPAPHSSPSPPAYVSDYNYDTDFPPPPLQNPTSHHVYHALGRHQPVSQQPSPPQPPPLFPMQGPGGGGPVSERRVYTGRHDNSAIPQAHNNQHPSPYPAASPPPPPTMEDPLHPYAIHLLNSMAAHFMAQQRHQQSPPVQ